ncbi:gll1899 [Gloeobacter violaceus PCC 7421]|uniref:Gll1899 protein n=1 Tax=Gloeobacter violaceus (strain ATCC 29082 / PCC 7421) TaxID=251221 RepID=Q7NJD3_GLOVI|nr:gll1899 [Gloeobacter violaceus PCC 7421]
MSHQPLIILTPPRSFSSVVCALLGRHPDLYGFPELNLFKTDTIEELNFARIQRRWPTAMDGLARTLAEIHEGTQDELSVHRARVWINEHMHLGCKEVFNYVLDYVNPKIGVDKSPTTILKVENMERAFHMFPKARFLHLTRHPVTSAKSIAEFLSVIIQTREQVGAMQAKVGWSVDPAFLSDEEEDLKGNKPVKVSPLKLWLSAHTKIMNFMERLPLGQGMRIRGEDLLSDLDIYLPQIAEWLGVRTDQEAIDEMKSPEESPYARTGPINAPFGNDPKFLANPKLRSSKVPIPPLKGTFEWAVDTDTAREIQELAQQMGY